MKKLTNTKIQKLREATPTPPITDNKILERWLAEMKGLEVGTYYYEKCSSDSKTPPVSIPMEFDTEIVITRPLFWPSDAKWWERIIAFFFPRYKKDFVIESEQKPVIKFEIPK